MTVLVAPCGDIRHFDGPAVEGKFYQGGTCPGCSEYHEPDTFLSAKEHFDLEMNRARMPEKGKGGQCW